MEETIQELTERFLDEIYKAETDEEVGHVLFVLFNEGYLRGFCTALKERIEEDTHTLNYIMNIK